MDGAGKPTIAQRFSGGIYGKRMPESRQGRKNRSSLPGLCCVRGGLPSLERLGWCRGLRARARRALRMGAPSQVTAGSCHHACRPKPSCSASCNICRPGAFSACVTTAGPGRQATVAPGAPSPAGATPPEPGADPPRAAGMSALPVSDGPDRLPGPRPTAMSRSPSAARTINASATAPRACGGVVGPRRRNEFSARAGPSTTLSNGHPAGLTGWVGHGEACARPRKSRPRAVGAG